MCAEPFSTPRLQPGITKQSAWGSYRPDAGEFRVNISEECTDGSKPAGILCRRFASVLECAAAWFRPGLLHRQAVWHPEWGSLSVGPLQEMDPSFPPLIRIRKRGTEEVSLVVRLLTCIRESLGSNLRLSWMKMFIVFHSPSREIAG
jgi:hypothetical protein